MTRTPGRSDREETRAQEFALAGLLLCVMVLGVALAGVLYLALRALLR